MVPLQCKVDCMTQWCKMQATAHYYTEINHLSAARHRTNEMSELKIKGKALQYLRKWGYDRELDIQHDG